ncbi:MAG TPA: exosortase [Pyrinomonadaceae bacterium]|nr:exosortase [Pyrinomonadaceae bacterium]
MSVPAKSLWRVLAISAALIFAYASVFTKLAHDWWADDNYSHGLLVPFVIGYILWAERGRFARQTSQPWTLLGGAVVVCALVGLWAGIAGAELFMQRISLVLILVGITIYFWGFRFLRLLIAPFALLLLAIPIPAIIFNKIAFPMQLFASRFAVWSMSLLDIPVLRQGNVIELLPLNSTVTKKLEVVEACSGIRSLMTLLTLAFVFAYFTHPRGDDTAKPGGRFSWLRRYGLWRSLIIVLAAFPIAIFTNALRVSGTGILARYYGTKVADGFFHTFSGWVIYIVAFLLLFTVGWVIDRFNPARRKNHRAPRANETKADSEKKAASVTTSAQVAPAEGIK